jgi:hypothetical protein
MFCLIGDRPTLTGLRIIRRIASIENTDFFSTLAEYEFRNFRKLA